MGLLVEIKIDSSGKKGYNGWGWKIYLATGHQQPLLTS